MLTGSVCNQSEGLEDSAGPNQSYIYLCMIGSAGGMEIASTSPYHIDIAFISIYPCPSLYHQTHLFLYLFPDYVAKTRAVYVFQDLKEAESALEALHNLNGLDGVKMTAEEVVPEHHLKYLTVVRVDGALDINRLSLVRGALDAAFGQWVPKGCSDGGKDFDTS